MGIQCTTPKQAINAFFNTALNIMREEVDRALSYLGEQCIVRIRDRSAEDSWIDHTGNLRSSIGYAVYDYGKKYIESTFAVVRQGGKGASEGRKMVNELASKYANVYALVVVAGMNYAEFVEAIESKDVLASTESWARTKVDEYLNKAKDKAINRINKIKL
jgi:hypothetical protein